MDVVFEVLKAQIALLYVFILFLLLLQVVRGTKKLEELHSRVKEMLGKFARSVPTECSFLAPLEKSEVGSSLGKAEPEVLGSTEGKETMTTVGVADKEGSKKATGILHEREGSERTAAVLHEHLPVNTPAKVGLVVGERQFS